MSEQPIVVFCDGASKGNPGPGGWGVVIVTPDGGVTELGGRDAHTTNNKMELTGAISALAELRDIAGPVAMYTDSTYVIKGIREWIWAWRRRGWKTAEGKDVSTYDRANLMSASYDETDLGIEADRRIQTFQRDAAKRAGIFHHLITLPTYHTAALSTDNLAKDYFGEMGMLGYVAGVQRKEIRQGIACVKHQNMSGSDIGDDHKEYFAGEAALKAGGKDNTMNQFANAA